MRVRRVAVVVVFVVVSVAAVSCGKITKRVEVRSEKKDSAPAAAGASEDKPDSPPAAAGASEDKPDSPDETERRAYRRRFETLSEEFQPRLPAPMRKPLRRMPSNGPVMTKADKDDIDDESGDK